MDGGLEVLAIKLASSYIWKQFPLRNNAIFSRLKSELFWFSNHIFLMMYHSYFFLFKFIFKNVLLNYLSKERHSIW